MGLVSSLFLIPSAHTDTNSADLTKAITQDDWLEIVTYSNKSFTEPPQFNGYLIRGNNSSEECPNDKKT